MSTNIPLTGNFLVTCEYKRKGNWAAGFHTGIDLYSNNNTDLFEYLYYNTKNHLSIYKKLKEYITIFNYCYNHLYNNDEKQIKTILSLIATLLSSDFAIIDYHDKDINGRRLIVLSDYIIDEVLCFINQIWK